MKGNEFKSHVIELLSVSKGKANAMTPMKLCELVYLRAKDTVEVSNAREIMRNMRKEKLVKGHQPGHSKSTFYYWID